MGFITGLIKLIFKPIIWIISKVFKLLFLIFGVILGVTLFFRYFA